MKRSYVLLGLGLVAAIALISTAIAVPGSGSDKQTSAQAAAKKGRRGPPGPQGPAGPTGPAGPAGAAGANGLDANPRAFAQLRWTGSDLVNETASSGIAEANVVRQAAGLYCVYGLPFTPKNVQATQQLGGSIGAVEVYRSATGAAGESGDCPNNTGRGVDQAEIFVDANGDPVGSFVGVDAPVYVAFD
jgi:hypothetical protein